MKTYFISGLGGDERLFSMLQLPSQVTPVYLNYMPARTNESLASYAMRMAEKIDVQEPFQLVGVSFGGMIASEISKVHPARQTIIISSVATGDELPWYFKVSNTLLSNPFMPSSLLKVDNSLNYWLMGATSSNEKKLLEGILDYSDLQFLKWALQRITGWENKVRVPHLYHIHGSDDKLFPAICVHPDYMVKGGEHLMVLDKWKEISNVLADRLLKAQAADIIA